MTGFLDLAEKERVSAFQITAERTKLSEAIIEKDFWVVFFLEILFSKSALGKFFIFKGGTSLSKAYPVIERFSEDIDLILDWRVLGYSTKEPWTTRSKTAQRKFNDEANQRAAAWIKNTLLPELEQQLSLLTLQDIKLQIAANDSQTVEIFYPRAFADDSLLQEIRLEIGPLAAWTPSEDKPIVAYLAEDFPHLFPSAPAMIPTLEAKRTFWEKATILHKEHFRVNTLTPPRYSRHYYDIYQLGHTELKNQALTDSELLKLVVSFKEKFYADNSANYAHATFDKIQLLPNNVQKEHLRKDYQMMQPMIYGTAPDFEELLSGLKELEQQIHQLK